MGHSHSSGDIKLTTIVCRSDGHLLPCQQRIVQPQAPRCREFDLGNGEILSNDPSTSNSEELSSSVLSEAFLQNFSNG